MTTVGADVEALRQLAQMFTDNSSKLTGDVIPTINSRLNSSGWVGEDADSFKADWHGHLMGQLNNAATQLSDAAATLNRNADEQEQASSIAGASSALQSGLSNPQPANNDPAEDKAKHWWEKVGDSVVDWWNKPIEDKLHDISKVTETAATVCTVAAGVLALTGVGAPLAAGLFTAGQVLTIASASTDIAANGIDLYNGKIGWAEFGVSTVLDGISIAGARGSISGLSKASNVATQAASGELKQAATSPAKSAMDYVRTETMKEFFPSAEDKAANFIKDTTKTGIEYGAKYIDSYYQGKPAPTLDPYEVLIKPIDKSIRGPWADIAPMPDPFKKDE